ncbi:MAG: pantoate--beta-alanine ligase [Chitinispirillaceae bacterium]|nr:pantoate--beta-alanine ligase [Chitinispirillaceae bacterium]
MKIVTSVVEMINLARTYRSTGSRLALVPTMGALHRGHLSLLSIAREHADCTVMSIFVNPTQFGPQEDYLKYPRPFDADCRMAESAGCDILFAPPVEEMYPPGHRTSVAVSGITERLCGASRPAHFRGVTTIVMKLFNIVNPQVAVFGVKDAQQVTVIKRMAVDLHCPTRIVVGPIIREDDGLALSSRNVYLTPAERAAATLIHRGLGNAEALFAKGERHVDALLDAVRNGCVQSELIVPEYFEIVDPVTLEPLSTIASSALLAIACRMKESATRLIDNTFLGATP